jgi:glycine/D-amino acid oxidase-like deaminating enzyme
MTAAQDRRRTEKRHALNALTETDQDFAALAPARPLDVDLAVIGSGLAAAMCLAAARDSGARVAWFGAIQQAPDPGPQLISPLWSLWNGAPRSTGSGRLRRPLDWRHADWRAALGLVRNARFLAHGMLPAAGASAENTLLVRSALMRHTVQIYESHTGGSADPLIRETSCSALLERNDAESLDRLSRAARLGGIKLEGPEASAEGHVLYTAAEGSHVVRPDLLMQRLTGSGLPIRGRLDMGAARRLTRDGDHWLIESSHGAARAARVIVASAEDLSALMPAVARRLPLGQLLTTSQHFAQLQPGIAPMVGKTDAFMAIETPRGVRVVLGAAVMMSQEEASRRMRALVSEHLAGMVGEPRDMIRLDAVRGLPDGLPLAGEAPGKPGLWLNFGYGVEEGVFAPALSQLVVAWAQGRPVTEVWRAVSPERYAGVQRPGPAAGSSPARPDAEP